MESWQNGNALVSKASSACGIVGSSPTLSVLKNMINFLNQNILIIVILILGLIIWNIFLQLLILKIKKKLRLFLKGRKVKDVEEVLSEQLKRMKGIEKNVKELTKWNKDLQKMCDLSITKLGVIRFNPFKDTGGDQSFVVAFLDSNNSGVIFSSLYTREGTRVYTKPIQKGKSDYHLTKEELEAIKQAINGKE